MRARVSTHPSTATRDLQTPLVNDLTTPASVPPLASPDAVDQQHTDDQFGLLLLLTRAWAAMHGFGI